VEIGSATQPGQAPYDATTTDHVVTAQLDAARQQAVAVGDAAAIKVPGGTRISGQLSSVGSTATGSSDAQGSSNRPSIVLTITLDDPRASAGVDQLPVQVELTTATATNVLAVPVTALVATADGGYAVEVVPDHETGATGTSAPGTVPFSQQDVPVTLGLGAGSLVQVEGDGLEAGMIVMTAQ